MSGGIFLTRRLPAAGMDLLREAGVEARVSVATGNASPSRDEILAGGTAARVVLSMLTEPIDGELLEAMPRLLGVANFAVGHDNIDLVAATQLAIPVSNTPDVLTESTADLTWALLLAVARNVVSGDATMRAGRFERWGPELLLGHDVSRGGDDRARTLGIIGLGRIGRAVARRARGFDMEVLAHDDREKVRASGIATWASLDDLLRAADFVSLHVPLTTRTRHLIGARELELMKPTSYLVNTARGPVVDEEALVRALRTRRIAGAALDVYEKEPAMAPGLADLDNVVLLPHLGSATRATRDRMAVMAAGNAVAMSRGEPAPHCINPQVYDTPRYRLRLRSWQ